VNLARQLGTALTEVAEALEGGDAVAAAAASERASRLCLAARDAGERVSAEELPLLLRAQARAEAAARVAGERIVRELDLASTGRRATEAYGR
jgi:hypothetical protein